ncbi:MAG: AgmX/PglI C-terminal domain-containing protein [Deltaproteobacteria bacterium]|nr:AgmX/PglI C-terminal domain-containing protein [Deltaproteobacteria bacterium]
MRSACVLLLVAACSGNGGSTTPKERPALRVVRCAPAVGPHATPTATRLRSSNWGGGGGGLGRPISILTAEPSIAEARVMLGLVGVDGGGITAEQVSTVVRTKLPALTQCYHADLVAKSGPRSAAVAWKLVIHADGKVASANASSAVLSPRLSSCIAVVLTATKFPATSSTASTVNLPLVFDAVGAPTPLDGARGDDEPVERAAWTPFTSVTEIPASAPVAAQATENVVRQALPDLDKCFPAFTPSGSLRAMLSIDPAGDVSALRLGGLGDKPSEDCMAKVLIKLRVVTPTTENVEIACDIARGDAQPWRVTSTAGYGIVAATKDKLTYEDVTVDAAATTPPDALQDGKTYLIVAEPDTPGRMLDVALAWTNEGEATVFALRDGTRPPLFLAVGNTTAAQAVDGGDDAIQATLRVSGKEVIGCVHRATPAVKVSDGRGIGGIAQKMAAKCRTLQCSPTLLVTVDPDARAKDLVEVIGAARRAGFERVLLGGEPGCGPPRTEFP